MSGFFIENFNPEYNSGWRDCHILESAGVFWEQSVENHSYSISLKLKPDKSGLFKGHIVPAVTHLSSDIGTSNILIQDLSAVKIYGW